MLVFWQAGWMCLCSKKDRYAASLVYSCCRNSRNTGHGNQRRQTMAARIAPLATLFLHLVYCLPELPISISQNSIPYTPEQGVVRYRRDDKGADTVLSNLWDPQDSVFQGAYYANRMFLAT